MANYLGTSVYVDSKNTNTTPDGSIINPFTTLVQAFDYADSSDESYVVNVINATMVNLDYTFQRGGDISIVGASYNSIIGGGLTLRATRNNSRIIVQNLSLGRINVYGGYIVSLDNVRAGYANFYDTLQGVELDNCKDHSLTSQIMYVTINGSRPGDMLANLSVINSSIYITLNRRVYFGFYNHSYLDNLIVASSEIGTQVYLKGCIVDTLIDAENTTSSVSVRSSIVTNVYPESLRDRFSI
jgi:hypothetical protein